LSDALERGDYKLTPVLKAAGQALAERDGFLPGSGFFCLPLVEFGRGDPGMSDHEAWMYTTEAQQQAKALWFANLNTPEEFAEAERHVDALDT
jgi:molybdopterin-guanine dinucleotide biosynthesis protein A